MILVDTNCARARPRTCPPAVHAWRLHAHVHVLRVRVPELSRAEQPLPQPSPSPSQQQLLPPQQLPSSPVPPSPVPLPPSLVPLVAVPAGCRMQLVDGDGAASGRSRRGRETAPAQHACARSRSIDSRCRASRLRPSRPPPIVRARRLAARRHQAVPLTPRVGAPSGDGVTSLEFAPLRAPPSSSLCVLLVGVRAVRVALSRRSAGMM